METYSFDSTDFFGYYESTASFWFPFEEVNYG